MIQNWRSGSNIPLQKSSLKQQVSEREAAGSTCSNCLRGSPETRCYRIGRNLGAKRRAALLDQPGFHRVLLLPCGQRCGLKTAFLQEDTEGGKGEADKECSKNGRGHRKPHTKDLQATGFLIYEVRAQAKCVSGGRSQMRRSGSLRGH